MELALFSLSIAASSLLCRRPNPPALPPSSPPPRPPLRVGLIGLGAIGKDVAEAIQNATHGLDHQDIVLVSVLVRTPRQASPFPCTTSFSSFMSTKPDLVVEAAGQPVIREHAADILQSGVSLLVTSIGVFTDTPFFESLKATARCHSARILLASGAMPALDWMFSSSLPGGEMEVTVQQTKSPKAWLGARVGGDSMDFASPLPPDTTVFEGSAREAASNFPKNANISAMLALATAGLDNTNVRLVADSGSHGTLVKYKGPAGSLEVSVQGKMSATNPRTSMVVALAVIKALRNLTSVVAIGV